MPGSTSRTADDFIRDLSLFWGFMDLPHNPLNLGFMHYVQDLGFKVSKRFEAAFVHKATLCVQTQSLTDLHVI